MILEKFKSFVGLNFSSRLVFSSLRVSAARETTQNRRKQFWLAASA